jgi:CRISPR/Cas system-associated endonuclease Cas1
MNTTNERADDVAHLVGREKEAEFARLLKQIEAEPVPERLLLLAQELQSQLRSTKAG